MAGLNRIKGLRAGTGLAIGRGMNARTETADMMALRIMLSPGTAAERQAKLESLNRVADAQMRTGHADCVFCGSADTVDNDAIGADRSFACNDCGLHFDADQVL